MTEREVFDDRPDRLGVAIALAFAVVSAAAAGSGSGLALSLGALGFALVLGGLFLAAEPALASGAVVLFFAHAVRIGLGGSLELSILGGVFAIAAWDVGDHAIDLGQYVGRGARTRQSVLVHSAGSLAVGIVPVGIGYGIYTAAPGGRPVSALVLLLLAAVLVIVGLRR